MTDQQRFVRIQQTWTLDIEVPIENYPGMTDDQIVALESDPDGDPSSMIEDGVASPVTVTFVTRDQAGARTS